MNPEPGREHGWLQQLVGHWAFESQAAMGPGEPLRTSAGTETTRALGDLWVQGELREVVEGKEVISLLTLGFDPAQGRFVGTFVSSMAPNLWIYNGQLEDDVLTLDTDGPAITGDGGIARYQDILELRDGRRVFRSRMQGPDGQWTDFMRMTYRRTEPA